MNKECNIIRDLISLYAENIASEESRKMVDEHCESCDDCKYILNKLITPVRDERDERDERMKEIWNKIECQEKKSKRKKLIVKSVSFLLLFVLALGFYSFVLKGNTWFTDVDLNVALTYEYGYNLDYEEQKKHPGRDEVEMAVKELKKYFRDNYEGCILLELEYNDRLSYNKAEGYNNKIIFDGYYYTFANFSPVLENGYKFAWSCSLEYNPYYDKWFVDGCGVIV